MRGRITALAVVLTAAIFNLGAAAAQADIVQTSSVTSVTTTSATLNGLAIPSLAGSFWTFQYGTSTGYGKTTVPEALGAGLTAVDVRLDGLAPGTLYHYRLAVVQGGSVLAASPDATFSTVSPAAGTSQRYGKPRLARRQVPVVGRSAYISLRCDSAHGLRCPGLLALALKRRVSGRTVTTPCASGEALGLTAAVRPVRLSLRPACVTALSHARRRRLPAELNAVFAGHPGVIRWNVTLVQKHP